MTDKHISERTEEKNIMVPVSEKFMLSIREASAYFSIGTKKMRRLAEDNIGGIRSMQREPVPHHPGKI